MLQISQRHSYKLVQGSVIQDFAWDFVLLGNLYFSMNLTYDDVVFIAVQIKI